MPIDLIRRRQVVSSLQDREYRQAFVADRIQVGVPLQMRALREQHKWSQGELGKKMDPPMLQEAVWRIENPNRANLTISTLLRVAAAFDVALEVKFVPFSAIADSAASMSAENQLILSFEDDIGLLEEPACEMVLSAGTDANVARGAGTALPSVAVDTDNSTADAYNLVM